MKYAIAALLLAFVGVKVWLATHLDLFADEVFYFQCSLRPGLAYADLPPMTAIWVRLGTLAGGASPGGVRWPFLLMGLALPVVIYGLASQVASKKRALLSAVICVVLPAYGFLTMFAIPDVLLALETALFLLFFERATRTSAWSAWVGLGLISAFGLLTHYRFATTILACLVYLVFSKRGRGCLRRPGIWLAGVLALPGLLPGLIYNLNHEFQPLRYFLLTRHDRQIRPQAWLDHVLEQMVVVSPLLWLFLIATLVLLWRRHKQGDDRAFLFAVFAALPLLLFWLASPLQTTGAQSFHWALPGYLPLLAYFPETLAKFVENARKRGLRMVVAWSVPGIAAIVLALAMFELGTGGLGIRGFREPFTGWSETVRATQETLSRLAKEGTTPSLIVADNYKLGGQLELGLENRAPVYILAHSKNFEHGRERQFDRWGIGEQALREHVGSQALVVVQWSELAGTKANWQKHLEWFFQPLEPIGEFHFEDGSHPKYDKRIRFYLGRIIEKR